MNIAVISLGASKTAVISVSVYHKYMYKKSDISQSLFHLREQH